MTQQIDPTPEELLAAQQAEIARQAAPTSQDPGVFQVLGEVADAALDVLGDAATGTGDVICDVAGGIASVAGDILGSIFD